MAAPSRRVVALTWSYAGTHSHRAGSPEPEPEPAPAPGPSGGRGDVDAADVGGRGDDVARRGTLADADFGVPHVRVRGNLVSDASGNVEVDGAHPGDGPQRGRRRGEGRADPAA